VYSVSPVSPTNQKVIPISWGDPDVVVEFLIGLAKTSPQVRKLLVKALVRPATYFGPPRVGFPRLLNALRVADVAGSTVCQEKNQDVTALNRWDKVRDMLLSWIRTQLFSSPPAFKRDVRQLRLVLRQMREWQGDATDINWKLIDEDLELLEAKAWDKLPKGTPRRGRRLSEHQKRIIASVELLSQCGQKARCQMVVEALKSWGVKRSWITVSNLWSRYKSYWRRHPERHALPRYWLKIIYPFILPELEPYTSEAWATWVSKRRGSKRLQS
jgi:hypothetical protein